MNAQPHTHKITVDSHGRLEYGDQHSYIHLTGNNHFGEGWPRWYLNWVVRRKIKSMIRKHDKGSKQGADAAGSVRDIMAALQPTGDVWASRKDGPA